MIIIHPLDDFIYELFPNIEKNENSLKKALTEFYTIGNVKPAIRLNKDFIEVSINTNRIEVEEKKFKKMISFCEASKFEEAKVLADSLIDLNPNISEYHRLLGQIYSELGNQEDAINSLIDALRWNPKNEWALLMMGNIFAKFKNDVETAMRYYDQVLIVKPNDCITLNNIGANLMQLNRSEEAKTYFERALDSDPSYPNTYYALALLAEIEKDYKKAFDNSLLAIEKTDKKSNNQLYSNSYHLAIESANKLRSEINSKKIIDEFIAKLSNLTEKEIRIEEDDTIPTAAKIEFAENYNREFHLIKYKSNYIGVEHLILHELMHLEMAEEARKEDINELFISNQSNKSKFIYSLEREASKLHKSGVSEENIANYFSALFDGLNRQIYNTPIDLFIEDRIFNRWIIIRPIQFLSLITLLQEGIEATTKKEIVDNSPKNILSKSKILNLINALHFKGLFQLDLIDQFKPTKLELKQAKELYAEFGEYRHDRKSAEDYELVRHWAEDLKLDDYFELIPESKYRQKTIHSVLEDIESDPLGLNSADSSEDRKMKKFLEENSSEEINMAVAMYMADAINYFSKTSQEVTKKIAFEIAYAGCITGLRTAVSMKQVGLNVASDPLMSAAYLGIKGGFIIISADDPGPHSSQTEQDSRLMAMMAKIPVLDPDSPRQAKEMIKMAYELSEAHNTPVMIRPTTRVCHSRQDVLLNDIPGSDRQAKFEKDPTRWAATPKFRLKLHGELEQKLTAIAQNETTAPMRFNPDAGGRKAIVAAGVVAAHTKEIMKELDLWDRSPFYQVLQPFPLHSDFISHLLGSYDDILVVEETTGVIEMQLADREHVKGKMSGAVPRVGELSPEKIQRIISEFSGLEFKPLDLPSVPGRRPTLCAGCPHRASFFAIKKAAPKGIYTSDIGCYTLGLNLGAVDTVLCMGAAISQAAGFYHAYKKEEKKPDIVATIGDSTFFHAGVPALIDAVVQKVGFVLVILDNYTTAMTGSQPTPASGLGACGEPLDALDLESLVRGCGVKYVNVGNPYDVPEFIALLKDAIQYSRKNGPAVVLSRYPCILDRARKGETGEYIPVEITDTCDGCGYCIKHFECPALIFHEDGDEKYVSIDPILCTNCGVCLNVCPKDSIVKKSHED